MKSAGRRRSSQLVFSTLATTELRFSRAVSSLLHPAFQSSQEDSLLQLVLTEHY
jgi:hypothetical protein